MMVRNLLATPAPASDTRTALPQSGLTFDVAKTAEDVSDAWAFVYAQYVALGLARPDGVGVHVVPQAVGGETAVLLGRISGLIVSTATVVAHGDPLPAERIFSDEVRELRGRIGGRLVDVALFADRRSSDIDRTFPTILELMRFAVHFAVHTGAAGMVCSVPASRARLFGRAFGFAPHGPAKPVATFGGAETVLMHATTADLLSNATGSRALAYLLENPAPTEALDARFRFDATALAGTLLGDAIDRARREAPFIPIDPTEPGPSNGAKR